MESRSKRVAACTAVVIVAALAGAQLGQILKVGGVIGAVKVFGKQMNDGLNSLVKHKDSEKEKTKVVVIFTVGLRTSNAIGAAQVMGPPEKVDQVVAVAQPEARILADSVRIRGLIPVASKDFSQGLRTVDGVGVSGLVDIRL